MVPFQLIFIWLQTAPHHKPDASHLAKQAQFALFFGCSAVDGYKVYHLIFRLLKKTKSIPGMPFFPLHIDQKGDNSFVIISAFS